jgi:hypothetical protein
MASIQLRLTARHTTVEQLHNALGKLNFAGFGKCRATFTTTGTEIVTVTADKDLPNAAASAPAAKRSSAK